MNNLIYQYWRGDVPPYASAVRTLFQDYADRVGAEYLFEHNPTYMRVPNSAYYSALRPVYDKSFHRYDKVLFADMDVFPVVELAESIFDTDIAHLAMAEEIGQPSLRQKMTGKIKGENDLKWAEVAERTWDCTVRRDGAGRPRVFNSGVVLYTSDGLRRLRRMAPSITLYQFRMILNRVPTFYRLDQNYLGVVASMHGVGFSVLQGHWNSQLTRVGIGAGKSALFNEVGPASKFIHFQHNFKKACTKEDIFALARRDFDFTRLA